MAFHFFTLLVFTTTLLSSQLTQASTPPYLLPIVKDSNKIQYYTSFLLGTPASRVYLSIDLSSPWTWDSCNSVRAEYYTIDYPFPNSTSFRPLLCSNATCNLYDSQECTQCNSEDCGSRKGINTCAAQIYGPYAYNHYTLGFSLTNLVVDTISIYKSTKNSHVFTTLSNFPFTCGRISDLKGLSHYTKGLFSLARKNSNLPGLIAKTYNVPYIFTLCLPSSSTSGVNGAIYFGGGPYFVSSSTFVATPLVINPIDIGITYAKSNRSIDYFINLKSILVDGMPLKISPALLSINKENGLGGTKLSTIDGYTVLHTDIYNELVTVFTAKAAAMNITKIASVGSFGACYSSKNIKGTKTGPRVPVIDLVLEGTNSIWRIYGANSMQKVSNDVRCLGFIDGGSAVKTSVVIGGKQMEDNLVEFDLVSSKVRVTSSLLTFGTSCSQFKGL